MQIIRRGKRITPSWPFGCPIECEKCGEVYALVPGVDSKAFDIQAIPVSTGLVGMDGQPKTAIQIVAIVLCGNCGYPNGTIKGESADVAGQGETSHPSA